jgi:hypothetical protein
MTATRAERHAALGRETLEHWGAKFARTHDPMLAWTAIGLALSAGWAVPAWTHDYLRDVARCLGVLQREARPTGKGVAPAIKAALLEPAAEITRVQFTTARRQLAQARVRLKAEHRPAVRATLALDVEKYDRALARLAAGGVPPRRTSRAANPFRSPYYHKLSLAVAVSEVLRNLDDEARPEQLMRPGRTTYRRAATHHAKLCGWCATKTPSWHTMKAAWFAHKAYLKS